MRRLLRKKGSVLFLVLVVMSLLIIAASATYYIVNNQHASVTVRYSSEQSYQTALSVSSTVSDYIDGYGAKLKNKQIDGKNYEENILAQLVSLHINEQYDATKSLVDLEMGDVTVNIKKLKETELTEGDSTATEHIFEISTNVEVNGETATVTQYKAITTASQVQTAEPFTRFLTSTGKGSDPRDVFLAPATIYGDAFFENEWTTMTAHLNSSLYASKSLVDIGIKYKTPVDNAGNKSTLNWEMVIGKNFITEANGEYTGRLDNVFVGNNMTLNSQWNAEKVYVGGDLEVKYGDGNTNTYFINKDLHLKTGWSSTSNNTYYVNGDLYIDRTEDEWGSISVPSGNIYVNGKIYYDGVELEEDEGGNLYYIDEWGGKQIISIPHISAEDIEAAMKNDIPLNNNPQTEDDYFVIENWDDVFEYISTKSSQNEYMNWDAEKYFLKLEEEGKTAGTVIPGVNNTDTTTYANQVCTISESCRIKQSQFKSEWGPQIGGNIVINADSEPLYIYLEPEAGESSFRFGPVGYWTNVIIEGQYPVVFILPDGTNFEMVDQSYIGHGDLLLEAGNIDSIDSLLNGELNILNQAGMYGGDPSNVQSLFEEDPNDGLLKFNTTGKTGTLHNNIFLVSNADNATLDFNVISTFGGYIYAPKCNFINDRASQVTAFIGGLVVSNYTYKNNMSHLIFTSPYDYYNNYTYDYANGENNGNIVDKIMSGSGGTKPGADKGNITVVSSVKTIGYK